MSEWKDVTPDDPKPGTKCIYTGVDHGDYGYTDDVQMMYRGTATKPVEEDGVRYATCRIDECTPRYWMGFTPERYKEL